MLRISASIRIATVMVAVLIPTVSLFTSIALAEPASAQDWSRENAGIFIYQRDVPTQPAQIVGEPAPPDKVILSGPDSPLDPIANIGNKLTDLEASEISGQAPTALDFQTQAGAATPGAQDATDYAGSLAATASSATHGTIVSTINQATSALTNTTSALGGILSRLPGTGGQ